MCCRKYLRFSCHKRASGVIQGLMQDYWGLQNLCTSKAKSSNQAEALYCMQNPQYYYRPLDMPNKERFKAFWILLKILQSPVETIKWPFLDYVVEVMIPEGDVGTPPTPPWLRACQYNRVDISPSPTQICSTVLLLWQLPMAGCVQDTCPKTATKPPLRRSSHRDQCIVRTNQCRIAQVIYLGDVTHSNLCHSHFLCTTCTESWKEHIMHRIRNIMPVMKDIT